MGKGARNRRIRDFANDVALGRQERAKPTARHLRRRANRARRATPIPPEHRQ